MIKESMYDWYALGHARGQISRHAEKIYHAFLERLDSYTDGKLSDEIKRQHALRYLYPTLHLLKSPFEFPAMAAAVDLVRAFAAQEEGKKLVIYGDRDADGVTSASLLHLFCREQLKLERNRLTTLVPREEDKYGITDAVAARIINEAPGLLITLDCGSSNKRELQLIKEATGCGIIVIDHHYIPENADEYPQVEAFINPKLNAEFDFSRDYCTAAITLRFVQAILYSYSREYNVPVIVDRLCTVNGVATLGEIKATREYSRDDLIKIFDHVARENFEMRRLLEFAMKTGDAISSLEIFNAVQSASFRKSHTILKPYLAFSAIGLVADLMPIYADNRILVREGLAALSNQQVLTSGLASLMKKLNLNASVVEQDLGFSVCPAINAAGRMGNATLALNALTESDPLMATKAAFALVQTNDARKEASQNSLDLLEEALDARSADAPISVAIHKNFHRGISGLIASKIAEKFAKPALVLVPDGECYRGSVRAFKNENVHALLSAVSKHLIQFGGHRQAAGFSVSEDQIVEFVNAIFTVANDLLVRNSADEVVDPFRNFTPPIEIETQNMRMPLWDELLIHAPYGVMNPHPIVAVKKPGKLEVANLGKTGAHVKIKFESPADRNIEGIWFFHGGGAAGLAGTNSLVLSGEPQVGKFMGRTQYRLKITKVESA